MAGNSHNCWPKFPSTAGGSGVWLGWAWILSSRGSLLAASKQRLLLSTSKTLPHTWQSGGQESEYSYHWVWVFELVKLTTILDWQLFNWGGLSGITWLLPGLGVQTVKEPKRQSESSYQVGLCGSLWRSCKVGLDRWCDKEGQTLWLSSLLAVLIAVIYNKQIRQTTCCQCLSFTSVVTWTNTRCLWTWFVADSLSGTSLNYLMDN